MVTSLNRAHLWKLLLSSVLKHLNKKKYLQGKTNLGKIIHMILQPQVWKDNTAKVRKFPKLSLMVQFFKNNNWSAWVAQ